MRRGEAGFTLLEVMIAFVIAALALSLLYQGVTGGLRATASATRTEEAVSLAKSHLAAIGRGEGINAQETSGVDGDGYEWHLHVAPIGTRQLALSDADRANDSKPSAAILFDVRVIESWSDAGHPHQISLDTHRLDIHTTEGAVMRREAGFTLLEILVAVVVLGFIVAGLSQATRFGINAWDVQTRMTDNAAEVERLDRVLRLLIQHAVPPNSADDKPMDGQEHRLILLTRLPDQPPTQPIRRAQVAIGVDDQHRLLIRWVPHPNAVAIIPPPPPQQIILAEGVDHLDVSYRQALADGGRWKAIWDDSSLPALVTLHVVMTSAHRHIPLIEAATMTDTNGSF